jgi:hypothetical protein
MLEVFYCGALVEPKPAKKLLSVASQLEWKVAMGQAGITTGFSSTIRVFNTLSVLRIAINLIY